MIYVRIELWPTGDRSRAKVLGEGTIANVGGDLTTGEYEAEFATSDGPLALYRSSLKGFPRLRLGAWDLLCGALLYAMSGRLKGSGLEGKGL